MYQLITHTTSRNTKSTPIKTDLPGCLNDNEAIQTVLRQLMLMVNSETYQRTSYIKGLKHIMNKVPTINIPIIKPTGKATADFYDLFSDGEELSYYDFYRVNLNGHTGYLYKLCNKLSITQKIKYLTQYNNIAFLAGHPQYAPEQKRSYLFHTDRGCIQ